MNTIQDPIAQNLLLPFRVPKTSSSWVGELAQTVQPIVDSWPFFGLDGLNQYSLAGNFATGFVSNFPNPTPSGITKPIRVFAVSMSGAAALGAGVTIRGHLIASRLGGNNQVAFQQLSPDRTFTTGDLVLFATDLLQNDALILRPGDQDFLGYFGQSLVGVAPPLVFTVLYRIYD